LGIVVSKRIEPRAVGRNLAKRLSREIFRQLRTRLSAADFIVRPVTSFTSAQHEAARLELQELLLQAARRCGQRQTSPEAD
jgi:ribonuclease P protein component